MKILNIDLVKEYEGLEACTLTAFLHEGNSELPSFKRPCLLVLAGGGYGMVSNREGEPIATEFYNRGYNTFNLKYSVVPSVYPAALMQSASAVDYIRKNSDSLDADVNKVFAVGFSAGGHLAGALAAAQCSGLTDGLDCNLNGVILSYAVINYNAGHKTTYCNLLGENAEQMLEQPQYSWLNLDESVTAQSPPAFIWGTANDTCVTPINSILYAGSCASLGVKFELHIFKDGPHGVSLGDARVYSHEIQQTLSPELKLWLDLADKFLMSI